MTPNERTNKNQNSKSFNLSSRSTHPGSSFVSFNKHNNKSFTLIELLVVLALVAILSVVVVMTLNPAELIKQARDSNRLSDLSTINTALNLFSADVTSGFMGTSTIVYVSLPDNASSTCGSLGLPALPTGYTYNCVTTANLRNTNGTGWIPVNFQRISSNSPISQLPIDPQNTTSTKYYTYVTGGSWKVIATPESEKYRVTAGTDGGTNIGQFEVGNNMSLAPFMDGLLGWWKFDEGIGTTTVDSSGFNRPTTFVQNNQTYAWTSGKVGAAINWQPTCGADCGMINSFIMVGVPAGFGLAPGTISMWVNPSVQDSIYSLIRGANDGFGLDGGAWFRGSYANNIPVNAYWPIGVWGYLVSTYDNETIRVYKNGVLINSGQTNNSLYSDPGASFNIATRNDAWAGHFSGIIDDLRLYNRALSAAEVLALYNATK